MTGLPSIATIALVYRIHYRISPAGKMQILILQNHLGASSYVLSGDIGSFDGEDAQSDEFFLYREKKIMASNVLRFPNGTGCRTYVITTVEIEDNGVKALNANGNTVAWIESLNRAAQKRVSDALLSCMEGGGRFVQPDWEALLSED